MKNKVKTFIFTRFTFIVAGSAYILTQGFAFLTEIFGGNTDISVSLFLRGSTVLIDLLLILPSVFAILMTIFRKKIIKSNIITWVMVVLRKKTKKTFWARRSIMMRLYVADTTALLFLFYLPYVIRLIVCLRMGKMNQSTFFLNLIIGIVSLLVLGFFGKRIIKRLNRIGRKKLKEL